MGSPDEQQWARLNQQAQTVPLRLLLTVISARDHAARRRLDMYEPDDHNESCHSGHNRTLCALQRDRS
jgi:hypothetical protein